MRKHLHTIALILLVLALLVDLVIWGAVPDLPEVGSHLVKSANAEAILASTYMVIGVPLDAAIASFHGMGTSLMTAAMEPLQAQIIEQPALAMDLTFSAPANRSLGWVRTFYWAPPVLLLLFLIFWATKPKVVSLIRKR